jgi:hypothetical protein
MECSAENPAEVDKLRPSLISFIAFDRGREANFVGTGFLIAGDPDCALALTARHVLTEGVTFFQGPTRSHAASALFVPANANQPSLEPEQLKVLWMGSSHAGMLNIPHANYNDTLDLACAVIMPQQIEPTPFQPASILIETTTPNVGDTIHLISADNMIATELQPPADRTGIGQTLRLDRRVSIRVGVVTGLHPTGFRQYRWPCFTTSIPAEPGMSGGFVTKPRPNAAIAACGIVCADNSSNEARRDNNLCGESVVACAWTSLGLRVPQTIPCAASDPTITLHRLMASGGMSMALGGLDNIRITENGEDCSIEYLASSQQPPRA